MGAGAAIAAIDAPVGIGIGRSSSDLEAGDGVKTVIAPPRTPRDHDFAVRGNRDILGEPTCEPEVGAGGPAAAKAAIEAAVVIEAADREGWQSVTGARARDQN